MSSTPQFGKAEYSSSSTSDTCKGCHQSISGNYYRAKNKMLCANCVERLQSQIPQDSHGAFLRGLIFGLVGFILGLILYAGFTILTDWEVGFVSLAVGWIVGKAIMLGSRGAGGRRYQITAVLLTYAAVSMAFVPILIHYMRANPEKFSPEKKSLTSALSPNAAGKTRTSTESQQPAPAVEPKSQSSPPRATSRPRLSFGAAIAGLVLMGLTSPFFRLAEGVSGVISLVILFVGMQFAWKMTRGVRLHIEGPFPATSPQA